VIVHLHASVSLTEMYNELYSEFAHASSCAYHAVSSVKRMHTESHRGELHTAHYHKSPLLIGYNSEYWSALWCENFQYWSRRFVR
jgi:hypothetical protein